MLFSGGKKILFILRIVRRNQIRRIFLEHNVKFLNITADGTQSYHTALKDCSMFHVLGRSGRYLIDISWFNKYKSVGRKIAIMKAFLCFESQGKFVNGKYCASNQAGQCSGDLVPTGYTFKNPNRKFFLFRFTFGHFPQSINRNTGYVQTALESLIKNSYLLRIHEG